MVLNDKAILTDLNYILEGLNLDQDQKTILVDFFNRIIDVNNSMICHNCKYYMPYDKIKDNPVHNQIYHVSQYGFGFCSSIKIYTDELFGCKAFEPKQIPDEIDDSNTNNIDE